MLPFEELLDLRELHGVEVSADGRRLAFVASDCVSARAKAPESRVWLSDTEGGCREGTTGPGRDQLPRFSLDGAMLAFASDRERVGIMGLYLLEENGPRSLGSVPGSIEDIRWSSDGSRLLVLAADPGSDLSGAESARTIGEESVAHDPVVRRPGQAWRRLYLVDRASGQTRAASPVGVNVWEVGWHGDGPAVAIVSDDPAEGAWYDARVVVLDLDRISARTVYQPEWQLQSPSISPDGSRVAFVEGVNSDRMVIAGNATVLDLDSGAVTLPASGYEFSSVRWLDGNTLFGVGLRGLETLCARIDGSGVEVLWRGAATMGQTHLPAAACSANGRLVAAVKAGPGEPPEVHALEAGEWRAMTDLNASLAGRGVPEQQRYVWAGRDGLEIEGILLLPIAPTDRPLPLVVVAHGGPTNAFTHTFDSEFTTISTLALGNAGYAVLMPNPRGSTGRGQDFARANIGDLGGEDLQDVLQGVRTLVEDGIVDERRVGITGVSYGGYLAAWAVTQTDAFAASVPCACVSNWSSMHNTSNIGRFDEMFLDSDPYDGGGMHFRRSPVMNARGVSTPTLVLHGELDLCTPVGQGQELYQALAEAGCETELVIYPREGHRWLERDHIVDTFERVVSWFDQYLGRLGGAEEDEERSVGESGTFLGADKQQHSIGERRE